MSRQRTAVLILLLAAVGVFVAACGAGDSSEEASSSTDASELLAQTFSGSKDVESGNLDMKLNIEANGGDGINGGVGGGPRWR